MLEKEQRILAQDSDDISKKVHDLPEMKLSTAVRRGMMQGRNREMRRRKLFYGIGAIAVGAAAIMITISSLGVAPKEKPYELVQTTRSPQLSRFRIVPADCCTRPGHCRRVGPRAREADRSKRGEKRLPHRNCRRFYGWTKSIHHVQRA